jgi:hypothetical protein
MDKDWKRLGYLKPEEKVLLCIDMTNGCTPICADGIRKQFPSITEEELIAKLCERLEWSKHKR